MSSDNSGILMVGGYGAVGREAAKTIRQLYPNMKLIIAGRDVTRATALAEELGVAQGVGCDLTTPGLGLAPGLIYRAVVVFAKDEYLHALDNAIANGAAYVAISDYAVEIAPLTTRSGTDGRQIPILLFGHHLGGLVTMATLHHTRDFADVISVRVAAIFDEADLGGATAQADAARVGRATPHPLIRHEGRWLWAEGSNLTRRFAGSDGVVYEASALSLLDVASIAAATKARSVRFDVTVREPSPTARHEVVIEVEGRGRDSRTINRRITIESNGFHTMASGRVLAFALERVLGLDGRSATPAGLWFPENVLDAAHVVSLACEHGIAINGQNAPM
ncbi:hypothetical protein [Puniceibacterium sp. IMCC21224]|uniref:hypothetical protein n=1 Tax=Puniceibacterium sp. IMCC21224 TaxID=1618204 RepID=UPI00064E1244|nr:hypothetical protein [Puniceibacterium sp. IMCC21224]KMK64631.1 hypothetical protein IMCC21224_13166 [Puniceibacterium sp. IMCC21224]